jgi:hypothetical protein
MPENRAGTRRIAWLDDVRQSHSYEETRDLFHRLYGDDATQAVSLLNEDGLSFPSLYILQPEISKLSLAGKLNDRNQKALEVEKDLLAHRHPGRGMTPEDVRDLLKWMLQSGSNAVNLGEEYDTVMDLAALLLVKEHRDADVLPLVEDMIFSRHRKGLNTYDAEWALFESEDPECIAMIARHLLSEDARDISMARRLLWFIPCADLGDPKAHYRCVMQWLGRNRQYLRYTGESNQKCGNPRPFQVALEHKYLQRALDMDGGLRPEEQAAVTVFSELPTADKELLGEYSHYLRGVGGAQWRRWMSIGLPEQLAAARRWQGGRYV